MKSRHLILNLVVLLSLSSASWAKSSKDSKAAVNSPAGSPANSPDLASPAAGQPTDENVDIENIKEKYWARGDASELGVVQNRIYTKAHKFQLGVVGGIAFSDPFLNVVTTGLSLGYHFNDLFGFEVLGLRYFTGLSTAGVVYNTQNSGAINTNPQNWYLGGSLLASILYGKLSLFGKKIIYYDMYLSGGGGAIWKETGTYFAPSFGLGQRFYINQTFSIRIDYRAIIYNDYISEKQIESKRGTLYGPRSNWDHNILFGVDILFGFAKPAAASIQTPAP